jgi:glycosyltransferase involved in cell wall biosynthesis
VFGRLASRGHDVTLLVSGFPGAKPRITTDGMSVHRVGSRYNFNAVVPFYYRTHLRRSGFQLFIEDLNKVPIFAPFWVAQPVVLLVHHLFGEIAFLEESFPIAATTWLLERPLARFYRREPVVAVSESTAQDLVARGFQRAQIRVIENGVDIVHYGPDLGLARFPRPTVLYMGRLKRYKRVDLIVDAFDRLVKQKVDAQLIIAGSGDARDALAAQIDRLGLSESVRLAGFVPEEEKLRLLRGAWVHVLTSPKEGWGISNLEAAACGTPTVASDSPGLRDSVRDGVTGYLVPHGNVAALADRITAILSSAELRDRLGRQARAFAEGFTWDRAADRMEAFLDEAIRKTS